MSDLHYILVSMISTLSSQVQDVVILHNIALYQLSMPTPRYCSTCKNSTMISITCHLHLAASSSSLSAIVSKTKTASEYAIKHI